MNIISRHTVNETKTLIYSRPERKSAFSFFKQDGIETNARNLQVAPLSLKLSLERDHHSQGRKRETLPCICNHVFLQGRLLIVK